MKKSLLALLSAMALYQGAQAQCVPPTITSTTGNTRCGIGTTTLGATAPGATLNWYTAASGGTAVATGSVFTTPTINATTNFYVSASNPPANASCGIISPTGTTSYPPYYDGLIFSATQSFTLVSLDVYPDGGSDFITIELYDNAINLIGSYTMATPAAAGTTAVTVPVNFSVPVGTDFYLVCPSGPDLVLNTSGVSYPYPLGTVGSITSGYDGYYDYFTPTEYFYFYNLQITSICEGTRTAVTATVTPPPALTVSTGTTVCANVISSLNVTSTLADFNNYTWSPSANLYTNAGATTPYTGGSASTVYFKSNTNGPQTYTLTGSNTSTQCNNIGIATMVVDIPQIRTSSTPNMLCSGSTATLNASVVAAGTLTLGAGSQTTSVSGTSSGNSVSPYSHYYGGYKGQYLIPASELSAAGMVSGNLTSLSLNVAGIGTTYNDFSISMAATTQTALTTTFISPVNQVYGPVNVTPAVGINTYNFATPFNWDGTSSVVVEIVWSNNNSGGTASEVNYDATSYAATAYYRDDLVSASSIGAEPTAENTRNFRPQFFFGGLTAPPGAGSYAWQWNPGATNSSSATVSPTSTIATTMTYTVSSTNPATTCSNTAVATVTVNTIPTITLTSNPANGTICSAGASATLTASGTSTAYVWSSGTTSSTISVSPTVPTTYTVTGTNACGTSTASTSIGISVTPTISATTSSNVICANSPVVLTANATPGVTYSWNTGASTSSITVTPTVTTTYTVTGTNICGTAVATIVQNVSNCTGINDITNADGISIYPNPANEDVNIAIPAYLAAESTIVEVSDALGKLVMKETLSHDVNTFKINKLEDGVYFFKVISNNQTIKVGKVVKR